jgi:cytochrome c peroxidase
MKTHTTPHSSPRRFLAASLVLTFWGAVPAMGQDNGLVPDPVVAIGTLQGAVIPEPPNLLEFIKDRQAAIALGKALFWDSQVGSDGVTACASCHFHAGADNRATNQLSPGLLATPMDTTLQVGNGSHNYTLQPTDFPFHKLTDPANRDSAVVWSKNDITSSQGVIYEDFLGLNRLTKNEVRVLKPDTIFTAGGLNTRRVEPRNTPTVINAVFNVRNFWDGRAQQVFNGVNPFGLRDSNLPDSDPNKAFVWKAQPDGSLAEVRVALHQSSLASQAVGPVLSSFEMSAHGRPFQEVGRRVLDRPALANQKVHSQDSVLGRLADPRRNVKGLTQTYRQMIQAAFQPTWWNSLAPVPVDPKAPLEATNGTTGQVDLAAQLNASRATRLKPLSWSQMEANFSLYFGLAIQMYEATLVSDQTPFDNFTKPIAPVLTALSAPQQRGMALFQGKANCSVCHNGPAFSNATTFLQPAGHGAVVEAMTLGNGAAALYEIGFYNIGVTPTTEDVAVGGTDPFGNTLSESFLAKQLASQPGIDLATFNDLFSRLIGVSPKLAIAEELFLNPDFVEPANALEGIRQFPAVGNGAFKTPGLRNIALTAPYMHDGSMRTLREVVEFYNRGGNFFERNFPDVVTMHPLNLTPAEIDDLVAFMESLTDPRVVSRKAPFDHPELQIPNGHMPGTAGALLRNDGRGAAVDRFTLLPATGANGGLPFKSFLQQ